MRIIVLVVLLWVCGCFAVGKKSSFNVEKAELIDEKDIELVEIDDAEWLVILKDTPLATYHGGVEGYEGTSKRSTGKRTLDPRSPYASYLKKKRDYVANEEATRLLGRSLKVERELFVAMNAFSARLSMRDVTQLRESSFVDRVLPNRIRQLTTFLGPQTIKADSVWDGSVNAGESQGEGVIVGIIDTGIVGGHHPSFAASDITNPYGEGNYVGYCNSGHSLYDEAWALANCNR